MCSTKSRKSPEPATGGGAGTSCMYARTFTGMRALARTRAPSLVCSHLHGHGRMPVETVSGSRTVVTARPWSYTGGMSSLRSSRLRARLRRDQRPVSANPQPVPSRKFTGPATGLSGSTHPTNSLRFHRPTPGGHVRHRFAMRRRCVGVDDDKRSLNLHVMVRPEGRTDSSPEGGLCIGAACPLTLLFTTATSDV